jgi:hypothetical protein
VTNDGLKLSGRWKTAARSVAHPVRAAGRNGATSTRPAGHQRHAPQQLDLYLPNCLEDVFSETESEFLCEGVSMCLLLRCATGAKGRVAPVLLDKDARG